MKIKWMNSFITIFLLLLPNIYISTKIQIEIPSDISEYQHEDGWHPHIKRKWLDDKNYEIYDAHKKVYSTSLIQLKTRSDNFLDKDDKSTKMQCGCRFIKQNIVKNKDKEDSFMLLATNSKLSNDEKEIKIDDKKEKIETVNNEKNTDIKIPNFQMNENEKNNSSQLTNIQQPNYSQVNSFYVQSLIKTIQDNNTMMSKIAHFLESRPQQPEQRQAIPYAMNYNYLPNLANLGGVPYLPQINPYQSQFLNTNVPAFSINQFQPMNNF